MNCRTEALHAIHTACGIETPEAFINGLPDIIELHAIHTACGIETSFEESVSLFHGLLHAIHTACGIET